MKKVYLETPEAVIKALKAGKVIKDENNYNFKIVDGFIVTTDENEFFVGDSIYSDCKPYILEEEPLKIEVGKWYEMRNHNVARCYNAEGDRCWFSIDNGGVFKTDSEGYFKVDRKYIEDQTGISKEDQIQSDSILAELDVLEVNVIDENSIRVRLSTMEKLLVSDAVTIVESAKKKVSKVEKRSAAEGKKIGIINRLKSNLLELEPNDSVRCMYAGWIDVVYDKGICKKSQLEIFINDINKYTDNPNVKIEIIKIATTLGYRSAEWAINKYNPSSKIGTEQKSSVSVNSDLSF